MQTLIAYYRLSKPGIVYGNAVHVFGGALLAWHLGIDWQAFVGVILGTSFIIASACVVNNYMDRGIDKKMLRTKNRPSVTGSVPLRLGMIYATLLLLIGLALLFWLTNMLVVILGIVAYVFYVAIYGWAKRNTVHSTLIGSVPGALPAMAGYVAVSGSLDMAAWLIFLLIFIWQMPHFYAISLFRKQDYAAANLPVLGVNAPFKQVRSLIVAYIILYIMVVVAMWLYGVLSILSALTLFIIGLYWLKSSLDAVVDEVAWARKVFGVSLIVTLAFPLAAAVNIMLIG